MGQPIERVAWALRCRGLRRVLWPGYAPCSPTSAIRQPSACRRSRRTPTRVVPRAVAVERVLSPTRSRQTTTSAWRASISVNARWIKCTSGRRTSEGLSSPAPLVALGASTSIRGRRASMPRTSMSDRLAAGQPEEQPSKSRSAARDVRREEAAISQARGAVASASSDGSAVGSHRRTAPAVPRGFRTAPPRRRRQPRVRPSEGRSHPAAGPSADACRGRAVAPRPSSAHAARSLPMSVNGPLGRRQRRRAHTAAPLLTAR
jgi:hypothetical protein